MSKKITALLSIIGIISSILFMNTAKSANANIGVSSNSSTVVVGSKVTINYTISSGSALGSWSFQLVTPSNFTINSCNNSQLANQVGVVSNSSTKSVTISCTFTAKSSGTGSFTVKNYQVEDYNIATMSTSVGNKSIKVITQQELENSYSKNNNLKALTVTGYDLIPEFDKNTLIYNVELPPETFTATITATKEDNTAAIAGDGAKELVEGLNTFEITVTAQNKSTKTYTINITVKELEPITTTIDGEKYTVVRKKGELKTPNKYFEETTIQIDGKDVPAFINETINMIIVGLKDSKGNISFYIYNENDKSYTLFKWMEFGTIALEVLDESDGIPEIYKKENIKINDETYTAYKLKKNSSYSLFIARNLATGEKNIYMYDGVENTVQRYNEEEIQTLKKEHNKSKSLYEYIILGIGSLLVLTYIIQLTSLLKKKKRPKTVEVIKERQMENTNSEKEHVAKTDIIENPEETKESENDETKEKKRSRREKLDETENIEEDEFDFFDEKIKKKKK